MLCLRCQQQMVPMDDKQQILLPVICLHCGLMGLDSGPQPRWMQSLESPRAVMAQHVILQPRQKQAG